MQSGGEALPRWEQKLLLECIRAHQLQAAQRWRDVVTPLLEAEEDLRVHACACACVCMCMMRVHAHVHDARACAWYVCMCMCITLSPEEGAREGPGKAYGGPKGGPRGGATESPGEGPGEGLWSWPMELAYGAGLQVLHSGVEVSQVVAGHAAAVAGGHERRAVLVLVQAAVQQR